MESINVILKVIDYNSKTEKLLNGIITLSITLDDNVLNIHKNEYNGDITTKTFKRDLIKTIKSQYDPDFTKVIETK